MKPDQPTLETQVALLSQFNTTVVMPFIKETKEVQAKMLERLEGLDYVHRHEYEEHKHDGELEAKQIIETLRQHQTQAYKDFNDYKKEIKEEFSKQSKSRFIQNTLAALFGAILAFLSQYAFKDILGG